MGAVLTGPVRFNRAWVWPALLISIHLNAATRDPERSAFSPTKVEGCEGFFTLGRDSELVIGAEERLDLLIREGDDVGAWDQATYAETRARGIREFVKARHFDPRRAWPPGMKLAWREDQASAPQILYTAALGEQSTRLRDAVRGATDAPVAVEIGRERFWVRRSVSIVPTAADRAALRAAARDWPGVAQGILWLSGTDTLVIYE